MSKSLNKNDLLKALSAIKLLCVDTDGVLTDGGIYMAEDGRELRKFSVKDGLGLKRVMAVGIPVAIVSASKTKAIAARAEALGIPHCLLGVEDKIGAVSELCAKLGIDMENVAHIGDDRNDMPLLEEAGVALTVANAIDEVKAMAHYISDAQGGNGGVREICELIVEARS